MKYMLWVMIVAFGLLNACARNNDQQNVGGVGMMGQPYPYGQPMNTMCLQMPSHPNCVGYGGMNPSLYQPWPVYQGQYAPNYNCPNGWSTVAGQTQGLGCFNQAMYPGSYYSWNWMGGGRFGSTGINTMIMCVPGSYIGTCPSGTWCRPIDPANGICSP
jgi:hypothetical protein